MDDYEKQSGGDTEDPLTALFSCLASEPRRCLLGTVSEQTPDPVPQRELATHLASMRDEPSRDTIPTEAVQRALVTLHHNHLSQFTAAGLFDHDPDRGTVTLTNHPAYHDPGILAAIHPQERTDIDAGSLDGLFSALSDSRRRTILASLNHSFQQIHLETLARDDGAREQRTAESAIPKADVDQLLSNLRHVHLPLLAEADLIDYDTEKQLVAYNGHPLLRVAWLHSVLDPDFRTRLTGTTADEGVGTIEGREGVVAYSQSLLERVDDELFSIFTATGLLEAGCFSRVMDASQRGVDVFLGTTDPTVRELIRENAPEIVLWEPDEDWLDVPIEEDRVARLLLADRDALMLGTLRERTDEGVYEETAFIGEGETTRQLLGSRLEQIEQTTQEFNSHT